MAVAHGQNLGSTGNGTAGQTSTVLSPSSKTVTIGNIIVVAWGGFGDVTATGVSDNLGNVYTRVERVRGTGATSDMWWAPVRAGGSITTITVAHPSTQFVWMTASELTGADIEAPAVGGGTAAANANPSVWVTNKTIPANGLAIGMNSDSTNGTQTAGANSGTPSTAISLVLWFNGAGNESGALAYAAAGGTDVTGFTGTIANGTSVAHAGAGAIFSPAPTLTTARPDADTTTTGWTSTPLWNKIEESSPDGTIVTATAS
jgi:hypothetical protein